MALFWVLHLGVFRSAQVALVGILARHYGINRKPVDLIGEIENEIERKVKRK